MLATLEFPNFEGLDWSQFELSIAVAAERQHDCFLKAEAAWVENLIALSNLLYAGR